MHHISICTVSMNRLYHIRETLPVNIRDNRDYVPLEFVLLDYNSSDGLGDWVRSNLQEYIDSGVLKYFKTDEPQYFHISHAKNMVANLSSGEVICMVDADNFAGQGFAQWINSIFSRFGKESLVVAAPEELKRSGDLGGKIIVHRDIFSRARGFDESLEGYGMDDVDLVTRLEKAGGKKLYMDDKRFLKFISHPEEDRVKNYYLLNNLEQMYVRLNDFTAVRTVVLYLLKDGSCHEVTYEFDETIKNDRMHSMKGWYVKKGGHRHGRFDRTAKGITVTIDAPVLYKDTTGQSLISAGGSEMVSWSAIAKENPIYLKLLFAFNTSLNFLKYKENCKLNGPINPCGYGKGTAYLNFNQTNPIHC